MACLRLRAEILLEYADEGEIPLTPDERETLERICVAPAEQDREFLGGFDRYMEE